MSNDGELAEPRVWDTVEFAERRPEMPLPQRFPSLRSFQQ